MSLRAAVPGNGREAWGRLLSSTWFHKHSVGRGHSPQESRLGDPGSASRRRPWEGRPAAIASLPGQPGQVPGGLPCPELVGWVGKAGRGLERAQALRAQPPQRPHDGNHTESRGRSWDSGEGRGPPYAPPPRPAPAASTSKGIASASPGGSRTRSHPSPWGPRLILPASKAREPCASGAVCGVLSATPHTCSPFLPAPSTCA